MSTKQIVSYAAVGLLSPVPLGSASAAFSSHEVKGYPPLKRAEISAKDDVAYCYFSNGGVEEGTWESLEFKLTQDAVVNTLVAICPKNAWEFKMPLKGAGLDPLQFVNVTHPIILEELDMLSTAAAGLKADVDEGETYIPERVIRNSGKHQAASINKKKEIMCLNVLTVVKTKYRSHENLCNALREVSMDAVQAAREGGSKVETFTTVVIS
ncbi:hypothetical protein FOZ63_024825 [Perkinsus olseni]|uniref:Uncharacterized protein n=2 Tax=Perkinsus olseni TaxID=32597 RepID=A0A7J6Q149_PEROL|nr:hypothetical protein FOZ63_024825 [Perkinsus olseni]